MEIWNSIIFFVISLAYVFASARNKEALHDYMFRLACLVALFACLVALSGIWASLLGIADKIGGN